MSWVLQNSDSPIIGGKLFIDTPVTIGRSRDATIQLEGDGAISRHHATITASRAPNTLIPIVTLIDESKFGSSLTRPPSIPGGDVQIIKCVPKVPLQLLHGDSLMFGSKQSLALQVHYRPLVFCCSRLGKDMKVAVEKSVAKLGGRIESEWTDDCTHLIMESLYATEKVLLALIKGAALIDPTWVTEAAANTKTPLLPDPQRHLPQPKEAGFMQNALAVGRDVRRKMFAGKTFVFLAAKQQRAMERIVKLTGGTTINAFRYMDDKWWIELPRFAVVFPQDISNSPELTATKQQLIRLGFGEGIIGDTAIGTAVLEGHHSFQFMPPSSSASQSTVGGSISSSSRHHHASSSSTAAPSMPPPPKPARIPASAAAASSSMTVKREKDRAAAAAVHDDATAIEDLTVDEAATIASSSTIAIGSAPAAAAPGGWGEKKRAPLAAAAAAAVSNKRKDPPVPMVDDAIPLGGTASSATSATSKNSAMASLVKVEPRPTTPAAAARSMPIAAAVEREHKDTPLQRAISSSSAALAAAASSAPASGKRKREAMDDGNDMHDNNNNNNDNDNDVNAFRAAHSMLPSSSMINALFEPLLEGFARKKQKPLSAAAAARIDPADIVAAPLHHRSAARSAWPPPAASSSSSSSSASSAASAAPLVPFRSRVKLENGSLATDPSAVASMDIGNGETKAPTAPPIASIPLAMSSQSVAAGGAQPTQSTQPNNSSNGKKTVKSEGGGGAAADSGVAELMAELEISHSERERVRWLRSLPPGQPAPAISLAARQHPPIMDRSSPNFKVFRLNKNSQAARRVPARFVPFDCSNLEDDYQAPHQWLEEEKREDKRRGVLQEMFVSNQKAPKAAHEPVRRSAAKSKAKGKAAPKKRAATKKKKGSSESEDSVDDELTDPEDDDNDDGGGGDSDDGESPKKKAPAKRAAAKSRAKPKAAAKSRAKKK